VHSITIVIVPRAGDLGRNIFRRPPATCGGGLVLPPAFLAPGPRARGFARPRHDQGREGREEFPVTCRFPLPARARAGSESNHPCRACLRAAGGKAFGRACPSRSGLGPLPSCRRGYDHGGQGPRWPGFGPVVMERLVLFLAEGRRMVVTAGSTGLAFRGFDGTRCRFQATPSRRSRPVHQDRGTAVRARPRPGIQPAKPGTGMARA